MALKRKKPAAPFELDAPDFGFDDRYGETEMYRSDDAGLISDYDDDGLEIVIDEEIEPEEPTEPIRAFKNAQLKARIEPVALDDDEGEPEEIDSPAPAGIKARRKHKRQKARAPRKVLATIKQVVGLVLCLYMALLIYGSLITDYVYDDSGLPVPREMSMEYLAKNDEYTSLLIQYAKIQDIYERILRLNFDFAQQTKSSAVLAQGYNAILNEIDVLIPKVRGVEVRYSQSALDMMVSWLSYDAALFLQNIAVGLTQGNSEKIALANEYDYAMRVDYERITNYMRELCDELAVQRAKLLEWTPNAFLTTLEMGAGTKGGENE